MSEYESLAWILKVGSELGVSAVLSRRITPHGNVCSNIHRQNLQRDGAFQVGVFGQIHLAHSAFANLRANFITTELVPVAILIVRRSRRLIPFSQWSTFSRTQTLPEASVIGKMIRSAASDICVRTMIGETTWAGLSKLVIGKGSPTTRRRQRRRY